MEENMQIIDKKVYVVMNNFDGEIETYEDVHSVYLFPHDKLAVIFIESYDSDFDDGRQVKFVINGFDKIMIGKHVDLEID